jgi:hypothetical protein
VGRKRTPSGTVALWRQVDPELGQRIALGLGVASPQVAAAR